MNKIVLLSVLILLGASSCKFFQKDKPAEEVVAVDSVKLKAAERAKNDSIAKASAKAKPKAASKKHHGKKHH